MAKGYLQDIDFVDFYDKPIVTAYADEIGYVVPMKHIIEDHLGLNWEKQRERMQSSPLYNPVLISGYDLHNGISSKLESAYPEVDIPSFNSSSDYLCLPVSEINLFLCQINTLKVKEGLQDNLYQYQKECGMALSDYWFRGLSINNRKNPSRISSERHDWCPREMSSISLLKGATRYAAYAERNFDVRINPEEIEMYAKNAISAVLDIESAVWDDQQGSVVFILAFMERAAFDILYFSIESNVNPEDLTDVLERNIQNAWENIGTLIISVQSPYSPFPGIGRGASRELV